MPQRITVSRTFPHYLSVRLSRAASSRERLSNCTGSATPSRAGTFTRRCWIHFDYASLSEPAMTATMIEPADVAIVGGGIMGCATAWHLAARGKKVTLFERSEIAAEQYSRAW